MKAGGSPGTGLTIRTLGPMGLERDGQAIAVPASRKARALLGYLILSPRPVGRQRLCEMFFDIPDDPRASLRWVLTKLRAVVDDEDASRIVSSGDALKFEAAGARIDVLDVLAGAGDPMEAPGLFLEDAELPDRQDFSIWLYGARDDVRAASVQRVQRALEQEIGASDRKLALYRRWMTLDPADETASVGVVQTLAQLGRAEEAREAAAGAERVLARAGVKAGAILRGALKVPDASAPVAAAAVLPLAPAKLFDLLPGVAILPFHNYSPDLLPDALIDGFLESAIHMLSRFRMFRVASLNTVLAYRNRIEDPAALGAATGAQFLVGGSAMARGDKVKVRYRIVEAAGGGLLASGDVDLTASSGAAMLEDIPEALVVRLVHHLVDLARERADAQPAEARTAVDEYLCGMGHAYLTPAPDYVAARACFSRAMAMQPGFAAAMAGVTHCTALLQLARTEDERREAVALANAAIALGADDAYALALAAWSLVQLAGEVQPALRAVDLAIRVNPLARIAWTVSAWIRAMTGEYETPMAHWDRAETYSPAGGSGDQTLAGRSLCCWMAGRHADALDWARRSLERVPSNPAALTAAIAAAAMLEDVDAARTIALTLLHHYPEGAASPVIRAVPIIHREKRAALLAATERGLEMARS